MSEKVFFHTAHKALWNWLSKHPEMDKEDWPGWESNGGNVKDSGTDCIACDFALQVKEKGQTCDFCPLCFPYDRCISGFGLFMQWENSKTAWVKEKLAAQIRDLPVREGVVCK